MNCEYLSRDRATGKLQPCGKPATHQGVKMPKRFYCADHNKQVTKPGGLKTEPVKTPSTAV